jgi:hypothetical protein
LAPPERPDWAGIAAVILAAGVAVVLVAGIIEAAFNGRTITVEEATIYAGVLGSIIGAVATYIGGGGRKSDGT